ncbi:MAG: zinc ribbon domain-containing protein [Clostridia bacterium]|nr:zinc ribbon domain-containing protein [Clostridia bacterium]
MPIYDFRCPQCGHKFTQLCSLGEKGANVSCPECSTQPVQKILSSFTARSLGKHGLSVPMGGTGGGNGCAGCTSSNCSTCGTK